MIPKCRNKPLARDGRSGRCKFVPRFLQHRFLEGDSHHHDFCDDPYDAQKKIEIPFVTAVMADLSGNDSGVEKDDVGEREFLEFDMDNFDERMSRIEPGLAFSVDDKISGEEGQKMSVNLRFKKMSDFEPTAIARQVEPVAKLLEAREALANLTRYMDGKVDAEDKLKQLLADPEMMKALKEKRDAATAAEGGDAEE